MIKTAIMSGRYRPGDKLTVRGLKSAFGVSETPVRAALNKLYATGALTQISTSGTMIVPQVTAKEFEEVMLLRAHLEEFAVIKAFPHIDEKVINRLRRIVGRVESTDIERKAVDNLDANFEFKHIIYEVGDAPTLLGLIDALWIRVGPVLRYFPFDDTTSMKSIESDKQILQAIEDGDAPKTARLISADIISSMMAILSAGALDRTK